MTVRLKSMKIYRKPKEVSYGTSKTTASKWTCQTIKLFKIKTLQSIINPALKHETKGPQHSPISPWLQNNAERKKKAKQYEDTTHKSVRVFLSYRNRGPFYVDLLGFTLFRSPK